MQHFAHLSNLLAYHHLPGLSSKCERQSELQSEHSLPNCYFVQSKSISVSLIFNWVIHLSFYMKDFSVLTQRCWLTFKLSIDNSGNSRGKEQCSRKKLILPYCVKHRTGKPFGQIFLTSFAYFFRPIQIKHAQFKNKNASWASRYVNFIFKKHQKPMLHHRNIPVI